MYSDVQDIFDGQRPADPTLGQASSSTSLASLVASNDPKKRKPTAGNAAAKAAALASVFKRPEGMHRELYNLLITEALDTGIAPVIPTAGKTNVGGYASAKARLGVRKAKQWLLSPFLNQARKDSLELTHWRRVDKVEAEYPFARFNKVIDIPEYNDEQYLAHMVTTGWSRAEIDYLFDLCRRFDLRWPVVHDRWVDGGFTTPRSIEDLKERYYHLCNVLNKARCLPGEQPTLLCFDANHERKRKTQLEKLWNRTEEEVEEEEYLVGEVRKIEARRKERERKAQDLQKLITAADRAPAANADFHHHQQTAAGAGSGSAAASAFKKKHGRPPIVHAGGAFNAGLAGAHGGGNEVVFSGIKFPDLKGPGPHLQSQSMKLPSNIGQKKLKAVEQAIEKMQLEYYPLATDEIAAGFNEFRSNCALLFELKAALANCEFELEATKHQYHAASGGEHTFEIAPRLRASFCPPPPTTEEQASGDAATPTTTTTSQRTIAHAMQLTLATPVTAATRKRKQLMDQPGFMKRLRRS